MRRSLAEVEAELDRLGVARSGHTHHPTACPARGIGGGTGEGEVAEGARRSFSLSKVPRRPDLRNERGGVLVIAAVLFPVALLLVAFVADVGNWYTHKRQLQNRADAGALAAGVEYAKNWKACIQNADLALKATTARRIADAARQYAGNPEGADYAGGSTPKLFNADITSQNRLDVLVNSGNTDYDDDTDTSVH